MAAPPATQAPEVDPETGAVVFNYGAWAARYPNLTAGTTPDAVADQFLIAGLSYFNNSAGSPEPDPAKRQIILFLITAHLVMLTQKTGGADRTQMVGRVSSASQGSVSVSMDAAGAPSAAWWWSQTQYGAMAYSILRKYALTLYVPGPRPTFDVPGNARPLIDYL